MKIALDYGHCLTGADIGARSQGHKEEILTREIGFKVKTKLERLGHTVIVIGPNYANSVNESLNTRVYNANKQSVDLSVSIHLNAGGGEGAEIYTKGGKVFEEAYDILVNLTKLGYKSRGIKNGDDFALVGSINCNKAMLVECCFIDSLRDMTIYDAEKIAGAIVKGIDNRNINEKVAKKVKNLVVYGNQVDKRAAEYLADYLNCPTYDGNKSYDYSVVENVYCVGGEPTVKWTSYAKHKLAGKDRYETIKKVLNFMKKL